jgi:AraC-like DNA-binding protein
MGYRETPPPAGLEDLVETAWRADGGVAPVRVLPDGCMDLIRMGGRLVVAGPDTAAMLAARGPEPLRGLRFRPGVLPRLLGVPAVELRDRRVPLADLRVLPRSLDPVEVTRWLAADPVATEVAPWSLPTLRSLTAALAAGVPVARVADDAGWSPRTLQRQCQAVYGYGPAMLRRVLRFRRAVAQLRTGRPLAQVAADAGYADQPHLHREIRALAGTTAASLTVGQDSGAKRSTVMPSGSSTVA